MPEPSPEAIDDFIKKWSKSGGHERGSGQYFLLDFCDLLALEKPAAPVPENELNSYTFERRVDRRKSDGTSAPNWIDLYKAGHFVLETKQGVNPRRDKTDPDQPLLPALDSPAAPKSAGHGQRGTPTWDKALERAHKQAERYIHLLPVDEGRPPFLIVCDVGHCFDLYAEFSATGGQYEAFPDPRSRRILLKDLHQQETRDLFRKIWHAPRSLDPSLHAAAVTRKVAAALADLAKSLEKDGHDPQVTAGFLQRCLFTMFAEDIGLLQKDSFMGLLLIAKDAPQGFPILLQGLWSDMATGSSFSATLRAAVPHFNGGLFRDTTALPLRPDQIVYLIHAAKQDWSAVEPAIFGTLLERALDPRERHKLGAHYTPRSYVERLVRPTLIEPLREKWEAAKAAAAQLDEQGKHKDARAAVESFHHELAAIRVLDPACGSGNFLYVSLELLKRLEAEVLDLFEALGGNRSFEADHFNIRPTNFLGIELNPRAAAIAQLVLWIGYFQWHKRTTGKADTNDRPLLPKQNTIECRDAVLAYDERIPRRDPDTGEILTIWDGHSTKPHPVTGKDVPDESARSPLFDYVNPRRADWPTTDYIVGNPPFLGAKRMKESFGEGYTASLQKTWAGHVPGAADFVFYWWSRAAELIRDGKAQRFGFITTNSLSQTTARAITEGFLTDAKKPLHLAFAIPDHPWVDSSDGAAVRISMTVGAPGSHSGRLASVVSENAEEDGEHRVTIEEKTGIIASNLSLGVDLTSVAPLAANKDLCWQGCKLVGSGFQVSPAAASRIGKESADGRTVMKSYWAGSDLTKKRRPRYVIDFFGFDEDEAKELHPSAYQHLLVEVHPERAQNRDKGFREKWWLFGRPRPDMRDACSGLSRYIVTSEVAKHRTFVFLEWPAELIDGSVMAVASCDSFILAVLTSSVHSIWALATSGRLEDRPRYQSAPSFDPFPFPALEEGPLKQRIRDLGERLDAHRKRQQQLHPGLTLTGIYNVLEKLRSGEPLTDKDKLTHDQGLVTILKQIHDELDEAVLEAYGWQDLRRGDIPVAHSSTPPHDKNVVPPYTEELITRLVALNHARAAEEKRGLIRWLRPDYQNPNAAVPQPVQATLAGTGTSPTETPAIRNTETPAWPDRLPDQVAIIRKLLATHAPAADSLSALFGRKNQKRTEQITGILETLKALGQL